MEPGRTWEYIMTHYGDKMRQLQHFGIQSDQTGKDAVIDAVERAWYGYTPEEQQRLMAYKKKLRKR